MFLFLLAIGCAGGECVVFQDTCDCDAAPTCVSSAQAEAEDQCDIDCSRVDSGAQPPGTCAADDEGTCRFE
ncbi:MAG: hypothetical protein V4850_26845 [Myxococcota bacterium]